MIIHIDAFTYEDEWDKSVSKACSEIEKELAKFEEGYDFDPDDFEEEYYILMEADSLQIPNFSEMINDLRANASTLFILWLEDEESGIHKYIMKDTYEHCLGFLEGIRYCGDQTGVHLTPFMDFTKIRPGLLTAKTCNEVNDFFDYEVFGNET